MDSFDNFGQRYDSFNLPRNLLKHHEKDKEKIGHAYSFAINQAKLKNQHILYKSLVNEANSKGIKLSSLADYDPGIERFDEICIQKILEWIQKREQEFRQEYSKKESELKLHIANNIKPSIQMSYLELARLLLKAGDSKDFEQYATKAHEVQPTNSEANYYYKISLLLNNKTEELKKITDHEVEQDNYKSLATEQRTAYLHGRVISAIVKLRTKDFYGAFNTLSNISTEFLPDIGIYTSFYDLARYLAVLGIICCKREEIASKVFGETSKQLMNHNQSAVKLVESYINANYEEGSKALDQLMVDWGMDSYVENVIGPVQGLILDKFIKQYLSTISRVKLETVAETFRISPQQCEDILQNLILSNKIPFRIDVLQKTLVFQDEELHSQSRLVKKAIGIAGNYCFEKQFAVLKVSFNAVSGNRQKGKGMMDAFME